MKKQNKKWLVALLLMVLANNVGKTQMITNDPIHTIVTTTIKFFQEPSFSQLVGNVKKLVQISKFIRTAHRGVQLAKEATETLKLINNYGVALAKDKHLLASEYDMISKDFNAFSKEITNIVEEMGNVVQPNKGSTLSDGERLQGVVHAAEKVRDLNTEIKNYVNRLSYLSQRRAFHQDDKIATARLYQIAAEASYVDGGSIEKLWEHPGFTYSNPEDYDNEGIDYETERKMAQEASLIQQELYKQYQAKLEMAELEAQSVAAIAIRKMSEEGFYALKMKQGVCPVPPKPEGIKDFIYQSVQFDSTGGNVTLQIEKGSGKENWELALKQWEYDMEEYCSPLYDIYSKEIELERAAFSKAKLDPIKLELQAWLNEEMLKAEKGIKKKYLGQSKTVGKEQDEQDYYYGNQNDN